MSKINKAIRPIAVKATGNPWETSGAAPTTVPLPNDVIITNIEGSYTERDRKLWAFLVAAVWDDLTTTCNGLHLKSVMLAFNAILGSN